MKRPYVFILIAVLTLGAFLYFYRLGQESLTTDEYFSFYVATQQLRDTFSSATRERNPNTMPPLYEVLLHYWLRLFGTGEYAQRSLSALLGVLSIMLLYLLARLLFDATTGVLAALLGTFSASWFLIFRQNRCYSLLLFLVLLSVYLFFAYKKKRDDEAVFVGLLAVNCALMYTHYFSVFTIGLELLFALFEWKKDLRWALRMLVMCCLLLLLYAPWYTNTLVDIGREPLITANVNFFGIGQTVSRMTMTLFSHFHVNWEPFLPLLYLPFLLFGIRRAFKDQRQKGTRDSLTLFLFFAVPSVLIYAFTHIDRLRYYAPFSFPLLLFLAYGLRQFARLRLPKIAVLALAVTVGTFNAADFYDFFTSALYEDWRGASSTVKGIPGYRDKEMVFVFQTKYNPPVFSYYFWGKDTAASLIDNIASGESYDGDITRVSSRHHIYVPAANASIDDLYRILDSFPQDAWVWILRYRDHFFAHEFRIRNAGRYFFHQIPLNEKLPQIDFYLIKRNP